jgi:AcrR family transcriptional regulator
MLSNLSTDTKIDPRVKRTQALIQNAFSELLAEKGFAAITVQDITQCAEINRATFYAHYPDKFALLENHIQQVFLQEMEKRTLQACHFSEENLRALIITVCEFIAQADSHCKSTDSQFELIVERQVRKQIQGLLELWLQKTGSEIQPQMAAVAASWTIYGLAQQYTQDKHTKKLPVEAFADQVLPLVRDNLRIPMPFTQVSNR